MTNKEEHFIDQNQENVESGETVSSTEIANLFGVSPSAVSNWKKRDPSFPKLMPTLEDSQRKSGKRYLLREVEAWARERRITLVMDRGHTTEFREAIKMAYNIVERSMPRYHSQAREVSLAFCLQLAVLKRAKEEPHIEAFQTLTKYGVDFFNPSTQDHLAILENISIDHANINPTIARAFRSSDSIPKLKDDYLLSTFVRRYEEALEQETVSSNWTKIARTLEHRRFRHGSSPHRTGLAYVQLAIELLSPLKGTIYDPACGVAHFLRYSSHHNKTNSLTLLGQEFDEQIWQFTVLVGMLESLNIDIRLGNAHGHDQLWNTKANKIFLDCPTIPLRQTDRFSMKDETHRAEQYRVSTSQWIDYVIAHTADDGRAVVIVSQDFLSNESDDFYRMHLVETGILTSVINIPAHRQRLPSGHNEPAILVLDKSNATNKNVLMIDAKEIESSLSTNRKFFLNEEGLLDVGPQDSHNIVKATIRGIANLVNNELKPRIGVSEIATLDDIRSGNNFNLNPNTYINHGIDLEHIAGEEIKQRLGRLNHEWKQQTVPSKISGFRADITVDDVSFDVKSNQNFDSNKLGDLLEIPSVTGLRVPQPVWEEAPQNTNYQDPQLDDNSPYLSVGAVTQIPGSSIKKWDTLVSHSFLISPVTSSEDPGFDPLDELLIQRATQHGDLLLARRGISPGFPLKCKLVDFRTPAVFSDSLIRIRCNKELILPKYLQIFMSSIKGSAELSRFLTGSNTTNISPNSLMNVPITTPPIQMQKNIISLLKTAEDRVQAVRQMLSSATDLYETLAELSVSDKYVLHQPVGHKPRKP